MQWNISARNTHSRSSVESVVTLLFYYHRQQYFVSLSNCTHYVSLPFIRFLRLVMQSIRSIDNCFCKADSKSIYKNIGCSVLCHEIPFHIFSRSFDICRSIESLTLCTVHRTLNQTNRRCINQLTKRTMFRVCVLEKK